MREQKITHRIWKKPPTYNFLDLYKSTQKVKGVKKAEKKAASPRKPAYCVEVEFIA